MDWMEELVRKAAEDRSPDATTFEIQKLSLGLYAVAAYEEDEDGNMSFPERYFISIEGKVL